MRLPCLPVAAHLTIRPESPDDYPAIREVVTAAFESDFEGDLVERIRASDGYIPGFSVVALVGDRIVGHAMISRVGLVDGHVRRVVHCLAPVAVAPAFQRRGVGQHLVRRLIALADDQGLPLITVEGDPGYYRRFGFEPAAPHGIEMELPEWAPREAAQVIRLTRYDPGLTGRIEYPPAFGTDSGS
jgi:putative acetyltransferase